MTNIVNIEDLRVLAQQRVPRMFYEYADEGSWTEETYHANAADLNKIKFRPRVIPGLEEFNMRSSMVGQAVAMPVALAPTGMTGMQHADGEILTARAAEQFGVPYTMSTMSMCSIEDVAASTTEPFWFQLYVMKDRNFVHDLIERARAARCSALVITLDLPVNGKRAKELHNGLSAPPKITMRNILNLMTKPQWCMEMLATSRHSFGNIVGHAEGVSDMGTLTEWVDSQFDPSLTWDDVEEFKQRWGGRLILKGIMDPEDARRARDSGADALVVSNHGGRQLDGAQSSIAALPAIVEAVGRQIEVHMDGGIRSGQDVLRALALGAKGVYIGRAFLYGLGACGEQGVTKCLEIIHDDLHRIMAFCGLGDLTEIDTRILLQDI